VHDELKARADHATGDGKAVLEATALMAKDTMLIKGAAKLIARGTSGERAIWESGSSVSEMLHNLGGYMAERATDVLDVRARIVAELRGVPAPGIPASTTPFILVAEDLAPADTATLDPNKVLALVTAGGGPQSHTAIIARSLGLPAVVAAVGVDELPDGTEVYVDGAAGSITASPDDPCARPQRPGQPRPPCWPNSAARVRRRMGTRCRCSPMWAAARTPRRRPSWAPRAWAVPHRVLLPGT
jgi:phosphotransferase system enzyme I (PtsI)